MVRTPLWFAVLEGSLVARTLATSGKLKRMRRDPHAELAPCTETGAILGPTRFGRAAVLDDPERIDAADRALDARYGAARKEMTRQMADQGQALVYFEVVPGAG